MRDEKCKPGQKEFRNFRVAMHGQEKIREKQISFKVREKSGNCVSSQEISKCYLKVSEKSGILRLASHLFLERDSL